MKNDDEDYDMSKNKSSYAPASIYSHFLHSKHESHHQENT